MTTLQEFYDSRGTEPKCLDVLVQKCSDGITKSVVVLQVVMIEHPEYRWYHVYFTRENHPTKATDEIPYSELWRNGAIVPADSRNDVPIP